MQDVIKTPNDSILVFFYVDLFSWFSWSRFFTGETTIRMKVLEPTNTLSALVMVGAWLGPDTHDFVSNLGKFVFDQMKCISSIIHPITQKKIKVYVRGLADRAQRRGITGCSSASSSYHIPESLEHRTQMGDLSIFHHKPVITAADTTNANVKILEKFGNKKISNSDKNDFAKSNFGLTGHMNPTGLGTELIYPPMMHRALNWLGSVCLRVDMISKSLLKKEDCWLNKIKPFTKKIDTKSKQIKVDEIGLKAFSHKHKDNIESSKFTGLTLEILTTFFESLEDSMPNLLKIPGYWTRPYFDIKARSTFSYGIMFLFGRSPITPAMRQLIVYLGHYVEQAKNDSEVVGLLYELGHFSNSLMEGAHKKAKQDKYLFSGEKSGKTGKQEYQERVIEQQLLSEWFGSESNENNNLCEKSVNKQLNFDFGKNWLQEAWQSKFYHCQRLPTLDKLCE